MGPATERPADPGAEPAEEPTSQGPTGPGGGQDQGPARERMRWLDEDRFVLDGVTFEHTFASGSTADRFHIRKRRDLAERYVEILEEFRGGAVVEIGIAHGGSLALLAVVVEPSAALAIELDPDPLPGLLELLEDRDLSDRVRPCWGVDQADRHELARLADDVFGDRPLDLVIDDASHLLDPTIASFEVLFPRLRPGGLYLIEDWNWQDKMAAARRESGQAPADDAARRRLEAAMGDPDSAVHARLAERMAERLAADDEQSRRMAEAIAAKLAAAPDGEPGQGPDPNGVQAADQDPDPDVVQATDQDPDPDVVQAADQDPDPVGAQHGGQGPGAAGPGEPELGGGGAQVTTSGAAGRGEPGLGGGDAQVTTSGAAARRAGPAGGPVVPPQRRPLAALVVDLVLARASGDGAVAEVGVDEFWVSVRRGDGELDPVTFRVDELGADPFGLRWRRPPDAGSG